METSYLNDFQSYRQAVLISAGKIKGFLACSMDKPQTTNHKPQTTNHKPQTTNHKPQTINHKPQTTNHKPQTLNP